MASHADSLKHRCECTRVTFNGIVHRRNWNLSRSPLTTLSYVASAGDIFSSAVPSRRLTDGRSFAQRMCVVTRRWNSRMAVRSAHCMVWRCQRYCSIWQYFLSLLVCLERTLPWAAPHRLRTIYASTPRAQAVVCPSRETSARSKAARFRGHTGNLEQKKQRKSGFNVTVSRLLSLLGTHTTPHKQNENIFCLFVLGFIYVGRLLWLLWGRILSIHNGRWENVTRGCVNKVVSSEWMKM